MEKDFIFLDGFSGLTFFTVSIANRAIMKIGLFIIFVFSLDDMDVAYINNVIIPDENVMITMNGSHLERHSL